MLMLMVALNHLIMPTVSKSEVRCNVKLELSSLVMCEVRVTEWLYICLFHVAMLSLLFYTTKAGVLGWGLKSGRQREEKLSQWLSSDSIDYNWQTMCKEFLVKTGVLYS